MITDFNLSYTVVNDDSYTCSEIKESSDERASYQGNTSVPCETFFQFRFCRLQKSSHDKVDDRYYQNYQQDHLSLKTKKRQRSISMYNSSTVLRRSRGLHTTMHLDSAEHLASDGGNLGSEGLNY